MHDHNRSSTGASAAMSTTITMDGFADSGTTHAIATAAAAAAAAASAALY